MPEKPSAPERMKSAFSALRFASIQLNSQSDQFGKTISELDAALQKLNLGVASWVPFMESSDDSGNWYCHRDIGYAKTGTAWGISIRQVEGYNSHPDDETSESWLFNNSPRWMRVEAVNKIPDLLESLTRQADETTKKIKLKHEEVKELAAAIKDIAAQR